MIKKFTRIKIANSLRDKSFGLIGWKNWKGLDGLLLRDSNSIHTFFVRFPIDVVFLDKDYQIIKLVENLKPFSFSPIVWKASHVLELPTGSIKKYSLKTGDKIDVE